MNSATHMNYLALNKNILGEFLYNGQFCVDESRWHEA
jgi:hypothetical protein